MKKFILPLTIMAYSTVYSQIGINTANPQGILHVDGKKDNNITGNPTIVQQVNDFVVTQDGTVGVGATSPDASAILELNFSQLTSGKQKGFLAQDSH